MQTSNSKPKGHHGSSVAPRVSTRRPAASAVSSKTGSGSSIDTPIQNDAPPDKSSPAASMEPAAPKAERRSIKARTSTVIKQHPPARGVAVVKASELQAQLNLVQDDLHNAREHLAAIDRDKAHLLGDLALTKRLADEASTKLEDSLAARRAAEEALELERFKFIEREQSAIDLAQRKEKEWMAKCDAVQKRHTDDAAALAAATKELAKLKDEVAMAATAKDEVKRVAGANATKVEKLTAEVTRLKSELEKKAKDASAIVTKLESEASELRAELKKAKASEEEELARAEKLLHGLKVDIAYAKRAEADANQTAQEWKAKAESLQARLHQVSSLNKSNEDALSSMADSFESCKSMLQHEQSQVSRLTEKALASEKEAREYKEGFLETNRRLDVATKEAQQMQATIDRLSSEHKLLNDAHQQAVTDEKTISSQVGMLSQEKSKLLLELDGTREERDKAKKAVEDLAAALCEVSSEAREAKQRVLAKQTELDNAQLQIAELKTTMKNEQDKHQVMLDESNHEVACLKKTIEKLSSDAKNSNDEWASKEAVFVDTIKRSDEGLISMNSEMSKLVESIRDAEQQVQQLKAENSELISKLKEFETEEATPLPMPGSVEQSEAETSSHLHDLLCSKEKEVVALNHEVTDLRLRETAAMAKASELSKLLAEATARKAEDEEAAKGTDKSNLLLMKLEMDKLLGSLKAAELEAKAAMDDKLQLQSSLNLLDSKITEANLTAEEEKIGSLRLKETLEDKEKELLIIARENDGLRTREAAAQAKIDELSSLLADATDQARKAAGETSRAVALRSPEKQQNVFMKMMCSPMDNVRHHDEPWRSRERRAQAEEIKLVEVETVRKQQQVVPVIKHEKVREEAAAVEANTLENSKIIEEDLSKEREADDAELSDDDDDDGDEIESQGDDAAVDQMDGLLIHGPTSSFNQKKMKKKALLKKFGSLLKRKAHFTKLTNHSS